MGDLAAYRAILGARLRAQTARKDGEPEPKPAQRIGLSATVRPAERVAGFLGGRLPVNPSGGVLSSNPIGASGMLRFAEAAMQVMGRAGEHQVDGARTALGHAYGGGSQYFSMWVVGAEKPGGAR